MLESSPARAQAERGFTTTITSPARAQAPATRRATQPTVAAGDASGRAAVAAPQGAAGPDTGGEAGDTALDPDADAPDGARRPRVGQRPVRQDGDLEPSEPEAMRDGIYDVGEPEAPEDGVDPTRVDARDPSDVAVFESPPAGFDPSLFDVEVEPILDRRPARLFQFEPYQVKGARAGSFVLFTEAELGTAFQSNVFRSTNARSDIVYDVRPTVRLVSNWRAHALEFRATGLASQFKEFTTENDRAFTLEARGRVDLSKRTNVEALLSHDVAQEARSAINTVRSATGRTDVTTDRAAVTLNHRFNRLSVQLRGSVVEANYGAVTDGTGNQISNDDRDLRTTEEAIRLRWEFKPTLFGFVEYALNQRDYKTASLSDGIIRDSTGDRARVGVSFGNSSRRLRGEVSVGYGRQKPDDGRLREIEGIVIDANLAYRLSALTSVMLTARSDVAESSLAGSGGAFSRQFGIEARHALHRYLIANAGLSYTVQEYSGTSIDERELLSTLGLEYFVNREIAVTGRYQHTAFESTDRSRNYNADEFRIGMRIRN